LMALPSISHMPSLYDKIVRCRLYNIDGCVSYKADI
jgi:hypothetical protein